MSQVLGLINPDVIFVMLFANTTGTWHDNQHYTHDFQRRRRCETHLRCIIVVGLYNGRGSSATMEAVIRRGIRSGLCAPDHMSLEDLVTS